MDHNTKVNLCCGHSMPVVGFGVWRSGKDTKEAVLAALKAGYRHIDTAAVYGNEEAVGEAIRESGIPREEIFLTTKLWNDDIRAHRTEEALQESLQRLGTDYVDLYLIHWPAEGYVEAYKTMENLAEAGKIRSIGVSNFKVHHLQTLLSSVSCIPAVNQIETNPQFVDEETIAFCRDAKIAVEAWSPLGSGACLAMPEIVTLAGKHGKSTAQIILRWLLQRRIVVLPKSVHENRILENIDLFDFVLSEEEMKIMNALNQHLRTGADPDTFDF